MATTDPRPPVLPPAPAGAEELLGSAKDLYLEYPWDGLEGLMEATGLEAFDLVGYGSLLEPDSARRTVPDTPPDGHQPVLAYGARRIFNYVMPSFVVERYGLPPDTDRCAALNSTWTGALTDGFNARLIPVRIADVEPLRSREVNYDLAPVVWRPWDDPTAPPRLAYTLAATDRPFVDVVWIRDDVLPCPPYLDVCRSGASRVSSEFDELFVATTVLADGRRPLAELDDGTGSP